MFKFVVEVLHTDVGGRACPERPKGVEWGNLALEDMER